jgi:hypothetical protein
MTVMAVWAALTKKEAAENGSGAVAKIPRQTTTPDCGDLPQ